MRLFWYRVTYWLRSSPAVRPLLLTALGLALAVATSQSEWPSQADRGETLAALGSIAAVGLFLLATSLTRILGQIAFATGVYSPRLAARLVNRPIVGVSMGIFAATLVCAGVSALIVMFGDEEEVGLLPLAVSVGFLAVGFLAFVAVNVEMTKIYRVSNVVGTTARDGLRQIERLYPSAEGDGQARPEPPTGTPNQIVRAGGEMFGVLLGFYAPWLVPLARAHRATIVIVPAVGDFVEPGAPLFHVFGQERISERTLLAGVRLGEARTIEQDPLFALRLLVDVADRALSPAVNDPYTAVQTLDRIAQILTALANRDLGEGWRADRSGTVRLWFATPDWNDYVLLAFSEIRRFGAGVMPVARRLRAALVDLLAIVPESRRPALQIQLELLDAATADDFPSPRELREALVSDRQGIGSSSSRELEPKIDPGLGA